GSSVYLKAGLIDPGLAAPIVLGITLGAFVGTRVLVHLPNQSVRRFFLGVLAVLGVEMIVRGLQGGCRSGDGRQDPTRPLPGISGRLHAPWRGPAQHGTRRRWPRVALGGVGRPPLRLCASSDDGGGLRCHRFPPAVLRGAPPTLPDESRPRRADAHAVR